MNNESIIRSTLRSFIKSAREARQDREIKMLIGEGYTIAIRDSVSCLSLQGKGYNFGGTWNRQTVYYTESKAHEILAALSDHPHFHKLEVIHRNDLRNRTERTALKMICKLVPIRNRAI